MADKQAEILHELWTPEAVADFKAYVDKWFDKHPQLREGASTKLKEFWATDEGRKIAHGMSDAYHDVEG